MRLREDNVIAVGTVHMKFRMAGLVVVVVAVVVEAVDCNTAGLHIDLAHTDSGGRLADIEAAAKVREVLGNREVQEVDSLAAW